MFDILTKDKYIKTIMLLFNCYLENTHRCIIFKSSSAKRGAILDNGVVQCTDYHLHISKP